MSILYIFHPIESLHCFIFMDNIFLYSYMYFGSRGKIERADMDGLDRRVIISNVSWPSGIALDKQSKDILDFLSRKIIKACVCKLQAAYFNL